MGKVIDIQCPSCKAPIHFNAKLGKLKCEYCDNEFDVNELNKIEPIKVVESTEEVVEKENYYSYNCPDCGAEILTDENTSATFCLYCGNTAILKNKLSGKFKPDKIIPFKTTKDEAIDAFKKLSIGRPLMPKSFNSEKNIEKITGLYIPFWLYEIKVGGSLNATGIKTKSWTVGDTHYTKNDYYDINRTGEMLYKRVPVDGSSRFANDIMNSLEPFYFHYLVDYNHAYLSGYFAEKYDLDSDQTLDDAKKRCLETTKDVMYNDMGAYSVKTIKSNNLQANKQSVEYALLPVWMVNVKFKNKFYLFAMNGQTGEFIGNIPLDKRKAVIYFISIFAGIFILIIAISYIFFLLGGAAQ